MPSDQQKGWPPEEYDPDAELLDRLQAMAEIEGGIEVHVLTESGVIEVVGSPQHHTDTARKFHLAFGRSPDDWRWELDYPKKEGVPPTLDRVDPHQNFEAYEATKTHWGRVADVRIYDLDDHRLGEGDDG